MGSFALFVAISGIAGLFFLDRVKGSRNSKALWLPVVWLWIIGSRTPSMWLGAGSAVGGGLDAALEGNSTDAFVFAVLEAVGILVLLRRKRQTSGILKASSPIVIYFAYSKSHSHLNNSGPGDDPVDGPPPPEPPTHAEVPVN